MTSPDFEVVRTALEPLEHQLIDALTKAWTDWKDSGLHHWRKRGRANYIWEQAAHYLTIALGQCRNVTVHLKSESYHFLVDGRIAFRLKKADHSGYTRNYPTQEALAFHDPQMPLTGVPAEQRVEVTYTLSDTETEISDISVVGRNGSDVLWNYSLLRDDAVASLPVAEKAAMPQTSEITRVTGLVRVKGRSNNINKAGDAGGS